MENQKWISQKLRCRGIFQNFVVGTDTFDTAVTANKLIGATSGGGTFQLYQLLGQYP